MRANVSSIILQGLKPIKVEVEVLTTKGIPKLIITGLADRVISESKERILSCLKSNKIKIKSCRTVVNLFPSGIPKRDEHLELSILIALLKSYEIYPFDTFTTQDCFIGSLGLNGAIKPVKKIFALVAFAAENGFRRVFIPAQNFSQVKNINNIQIIALDSLKQLLKNNWRSQKTTAAEYVLKPLTLEVTINDLIGNEQVKRILQISAAGQHHLLLTGPPGTGKTLMAKSILSILPSLSYAESIEVSKVYSAVFDERILTSTPPFREPHFRLSPSAFIGGGLNLSPGEISLSHLGVLFLDEVSSFKNENLDCLKEPMESGLIKINQLGLSVKYPANFILIAAQNPCPCGFYGSQVKACQCSPWQRKRYQDRISGSILDRIDLFFQTDLSKNKFILTKKHSFSNLDTIQNKITAARESQRQRYKHLPVRTNAKLTGSQVKKLIYLNNDCVRFLEKATNSFQLSSRSIFKTIKVARTIADLDGASLVKREHLMEALSYRCRLSLLS